MLRILTALFLLLVACSAHAACPTNAPINGVYDLVSYGGTIPAAVLNNPSVDGITIRVSGWDSIELTEGNYNWSGLDSMIAQVSGTCPHKNIAILIPAGYHTPNWVYAAGAASYSWIQYKTFGPALCSTVKMPLPWDTTFQAKWAGFVAAFAARYGSNKQIARVYLAGPTNSSTGELLYPQGGVVGIGTGSVTCNGTGGFQCCSNNNDQNWINAGYTRTKMESAVDWGIDLYEARFAASGIPINIAALPCGLPPIDASGNLISGCGDTVGVDDVVNYGVNTYGKGRFIVQNSGLQSSPGSQLATFWDEMLNWSATVSVGFQYANAVGTTNFNTINQTGESKHASYIEFYETDLTDPGNAAAITSAHNALLQQQ